VEHINTVSMKMSAVKLLAPLLKVSDTLRLGHTAAKVRRDRAKMAVGVDHMMSVLLSEDAGYLAIGF
jgi:hypothetical protein